MLRIVDVTSSSIGTAGMLGPLWYDEVEPPEFSGMAVSGRAKLAHLAYSQELAKRLEGSGVSVFAAAVGELTDRFTREEQQGRRATVS